MEHELTATGTGGATPWWRSARLLGGMLTLLLGVLTLAESASYPRGTALRMGPGFFPTMLGLLLAVLGILLAGVGLRTRDPAGRPEGRALLCVLAGLLAFSLVLPRFGLLPAVVLLVLLAAGASPSSRPLPTLGLAVLLAAASWFLFVWLLGLPLPALAW